MNKILMVLCVIITNGYTYSQINKSTDSLKFYGDAMFSLKFTEHRKFACEQFIYLSKKLILTSQDTSLLGFHPSFIHTESQDKLFKIISWQIEYDSKDYRYYAYIFQPGAKPLLLESTERNLDRINYESFNNDNWYGILYYQFLPVVVDGYYTLFGYRFAKNGLKYRIIELLKNDNGKLIFGAPLFKIIDKEGEEDYLYRKVIPYSLSANMQISYDNSLNLIYYDHIDNYTDPKSGEILLVPDGTFEAFELKDNTWVYIPYHQLQKLKQAPREKPILDSKNKDLFGRKKK